ncbi:glutamic acid-rich protein-like [Papaver somniferum]|uniref:glutamic acid-rich protein-like n=1 Tax=Papaver somniferum TaxID=3469 RepID=UPI000E704B31|nr:glutamic acid-rich protein-like [Papaver somniferum]
MRKKSPAKRKSEDDEKDARQRKKDRIRRKIQRAEEKRQFLDVVPSDSDADVPEEETTWGLPDQCARELEIPMEQIDAEAKAEEDSDSYDDFYVHPDVTNSHDSDSEEEDSEKDSDEDSEKDNDDESGNSYGSDE